MVYKIIFKKLCFSLLSSFPLSSTLIPHIQSLEVNDLSHIPQCFAICSITPGPKPILLNATRIIGSMRAVLAFWSGRIWFSYHLFCAAGVIFFHSNSA